MKKYIRFRIKPAKNTGQVMEITQETPLEEFSPIELSFDNNLVIINNAIIRCVYEGLYDFQINLKARANNNNLFIESIKIINKQNFISNNDREYNYIFIKKFLINSNQDFVHYTADEFTKIVKPLFKGDSVNVFPNYEIPKDTQQDLLFIDRIETTRFMDCSDEMPLKNWNLEITYNSNKTVIVPFEFQIKNYEQWQYK